MKLSGSILVASLVARSEAFNVEQVGGRPNRRDLIHGIAGLAGANMLSTILPVPALASGGATAGKYT